ncbi:OsmC family protein [Chengkuizengella axinellae]|uniref:OsmC family protein n=1 Tax=Chengkuizengella axinellae TaxID=3064388 RepID=A0ABT9J667_9BACL|nr:OsmC family protein [Chengkuizengella sp. 2205SS18-9]MDP5277111.1 OsmC family protein [Chengkuizengella sp. 2205SS18-9]
MEFNMKKVGFFTELPYGQLDVSGDEEFGFRPYQLLVSSIAVCSGGILRRILNKQRINFDDLHIKADIERNEEKADRIEKIHLHFTIVSSDIDDKKMQKAIELTTKNCSMVQSVIESIEITKTFEIK